jgi:hypothetical protein
MPERYRLDMSSMGVIMDQYAKCVLFVPLPFESTLTRALLPPAVNSPNSTDPKSLARSLRGRRVTSTFRLLGVEVPECVCYPLKSGSGVASALTLGMPAVVVVRLSPFPLPSRNCCPVLRLQRISHSKDTPHHLSINYPFIVLTSLIGVHSLISLHRSRCHDELLPSALACSFASRPRVRRPLSRILTFAF